MDQERLKKQQELAAAALYQQLQHQHFLQLVGRYGELRGWCGQAGVLGGPLSEPGVSAAASSRSARSGKRQLWGT